jgi:hypothetical protein
VSTKPVGSHTSTHIQTFKLSESIGYLTLSLRSRFFLRWRRAPSANTLALDDSIHFFRYISSLRPTLLSLSGLIHYFSQSMLFRRIVLG